MPAGTAALTFSVAVSASPGDGAGLTGASVIDPPLGDGLIAVIAACVTTPSASDAETSRVAAVPTPVTSGPPQLGMIGALPPLTVWLPRPPKVSTAKPSHSTAGSNASAPLVSPASTEGLRRSVLSAVLVSPAPHSAPGSKPIWPITSRIGPPAPPLRSTTASSPLYQLVEVLVWSACARIAAAAVERASTNTSPATTVPFRGRARLGVVLPFRYICTM